MAPRKSVHDVPAPVSIITGADNDFAVSSPTSLATDPAPVVKVNKAHLAEIKTALDDILTKVRRGNRVDVWVRAHKAGEGATGSSSSRTHTDVTIPVPPRIPLTSQYLVDQAFTPSRLHPTVHLSLGYASVLISLGAMLYCMRMDFEESKPALWIAVVSYATFQGALWAWKRWVERGEVFRGRRRRIVKRIETDLIQIYTSTSLLCPPSTDITVSPNSRPDSPVSPGSPMSSRSSDSSPTSSIPLLGPPPIQPHPQGPTYLIHLKLATTSNNGKSLIHKARVVSGKPVGEVVDEDGGVEEGQVTRWIAGLLDEAGLVGVEDESDETASKKD